MIDGYDYIAELDPYADIGYEEPDVDLSEHGLEVGYGSATPMELADEFPLPWDEIEPTLTNATNVVWERGIPLTRVLKKGVKGNDVVMIKRALSIADYMKWEKFTQTWGDKAIAATKRFQKDHKIAQTGNFWAVTFKALAATKGAGSRKNRMAIGAFEADGLLRYYRHHTITPEQRVRQAIVDAQRFWIARNSQISYSQARPFPLLKPPSVPSRIDCSGFNTIGYYAGGARNPNVVGGVRLSWSFHGGQGYTGSLMGGGIRCAREQLKLADLIFYGFTQRRSPAFNVGDPTHVALVIDLNPLTVATMGTSLDPRARLYRYRHDVNHYRTYPVLP
jgi:peptidoglycan hydrolase-like protein with peptidoglycan-binding domain